MCPQFHQVMHKALPYFKSKLLISVAITRKENHFCVQVCFPSSLVYFAEQHVKTQDEDSSDLEAT